MSALDVSVQAQIINFVNGINRAEPDHSYYCPRPSSGSTSRGRLAVMLWEPLSSTVMPRRLHILDTLHPKFVGGYTTEPASKQRLMAEDAIHEISSAKSSGCAALPSPASPQCANDLPYVAQTKVVQSANHDIACWHV